MSVSGNDIWRTIGFLEEDTRGLLTKLRDLRMMLATLDLPKEKAGVICERCGVEKRDQDDLREHRANVHGDNVLGAAEAALTKAEAILPNLHDQATA